MPEKVKVNYMILAETVTKLDALCQKTHRNPGQMIDTLVEKEWKELEAAGQAPALAIDENDNGNHGQAA